MKTIAFIALALSACALNPANKGVPGNPQVTAPHVPGTVFTIVFENESAQDVAKAKLAFFRELGETAGTADAYISSTHPSLPNYIQMTSGFKNGVINNKPPRENTQIPGSHNLADQLDAAGIKWRAYMESMGKPCALDANAPYTPHHNPFVYYASIANDRARCEGRVVDFDQNFATDLASNQYRYMWITPNMCNNMHDCPMEVGDAWLRKVVGQIKESPGYKHGGAIFILFDEGSVRVLGAGADLATHVISPQLVSPGYRTMTRFDHRSYLATVQDIFRIPRLPTTEKAVPMNEFFVHTGS
jgi:acid phosphatase